MLPTDLSNVTEENAEARYQALYAACAAGNLNAVATIKQISALYQRTNSPVIKSYCLLFYGAAVDTNTLSTNSLKQLSQRLTALLEGLSDFRVKNPEGHYIHFLSHATYLAQSIHDAGGSIGWKPLLSAYLRADEPFGWNEDIVLAECLLDITPEASFPTLLSQLSVGEDVGPKANNKRALWLAMKVLNQHAPRVDDAIFSELVEALAAIVQ